MAGTPPVGTLPWGQVSEHPWVLSPCSFPVVLCVSVTGQNISQNIRKCLAQGWHPPRGGTGHLHHPLSPLPDLDAELQLDRLKPKLSRRVLLLQGHQTSWHQTLVLAVGMSPLCHNLTAYLRVRGWCHWAGTCGAGDSGALGQEGWGPPAPCLWCHRTVVSPGQG